MATLSTEQATDPSTGKVVTVLAAGCTAEPKLVVIDGKTVTRIVVSNCP